jgi:putative addiction module killer protein
VIEVRQTTVYSRWFAKLHDPSAKARIDIRVRRVALGNFGDVKSVGQGVQELRVDYGPGYRIYFARHGDVVVILLCGGDKRTQDADIRRAQDLAKEL